MNCEQFEMAVLAEPHTDSAECAAHARECSDCRALQSKAVTLDARLQQALAVSVPASLGAPVPDMATLDSDLSQDVESNVVSLEAKRRKPRFAAPTWAIAACVALVALFVVRQQDGVDATPNAEALALTAEVIEHMGPEIGSMRLVSSRVSAGKLDAVLSPAGAQFDEVPGVISYAKSCLINGKLVPHLVVQGAEGPVTILLMPGESVDGPVSIMRDGFEGVILPVGDGGSVAIIGRDQASVDAVRRQTENGLSFSI
ncbi:MAG: DUF3379 family protein [Pseudomonadota bacterium]